MIPGTKEFFIAASDHSEWGTAHTVWGEVMTHATCKLCLMAHLMPHNKSNMVM